MGLVFHQHANPITGTMWAAEDERGRSYIVLEVDGLYTASTQSVRNGRGHTYHIIPHSEGVMTCEEAQDACRRYADAN